ncbi:heme ABC exporter ATP-binding protein CcmA [Rhizobium sp. LjRoot254]
MTVSDLAARRGEDLIFSGISFTLRAGEALVVTGRNGSGKSTLIRVIAGLLASETGRVSVSVDGAMIPRAAEACHYLGHRNAMKREMTVEENLVFWKRFMGDFTGGSGVEPEEAATQLGLAELLHLPFGYLSAGQQRRMAMAKLLCAWRPVWLLDEPTAAVDVQSEELFAGLMRGHLARGGIIIAATHQELGIEGAKGLEMKGFEYHEAFA